MHLSACSQSASDSPEISAAKVQPVPTQTIGWNQEWLGTSCFGRRVVLVTSALCLGTWGGGKGFGCHARLSWALSATVSVH